MKIAVPSDTKELGLESKISLNFSYPDFYFVFDTDTNELYTVTNKKSHHDREESNPAGFLSLIGADTAVCLDLNERDLDLVKSAGINIHKTNSDDIKGALIDFLQGNTLQI